jgi:PBSX family phage terminase large subunit
MSGSVRSGKTFAQHLIINDFLASPECLPEVDIILSGKAGDTLERNMVKDIMKMATMFGRGKDFEYHRQPRRIHYKPKKIDLWVIGANDDGAEERVRGMTAQAMFPDEITAQNKACFLQQIARVSAGIRLKVGTTNPDSPSHWAKTLFIDPGIYGEIDGGFNYYEFDITQDNPVLDTGYIKTLDSVYTGIDKERFLLGKWVADTETLILPEFQEHEEHIVKKFDMPEHCTKIVSMDLGMVDDTSIVFGYYDFSEDKKVIQDSIFLKHPSTEDIANAIKQKEQELWGDQAPYGRYSDTNLHVIHDLHMLHGVQFSPTRKDDKQAQVNALRVAFKNHEYMVHPRNNKLIGQLRIGSWNKTKKSYERTEEEGHFDGIDSCVYFNRNIQNVVNINPFPYGIGIKPQTHHITEKFYMDKPMSEKAKVAQAFLGERYAYSNR